MAEKAVMISLRVTEGESEMIKQAALEAGMTVSQWIRARIVGIR
jgi:uncharacterized protein (DUF1778 family)